MPNRHCLVVAWFVMFTTTLRAWPATDLDPKQIFDTKVAPILARRCLDCHSGAEPKGKLDLSSRERAIAGGDTGVAIVAGKPDESLLWEQVDTHEMPPKSPLADAEKMILREWIASGAQWGTDPIDPYQATTSRRAGRDWWSLQPVRRPQVPITRDDWARSPMDSFVWEKLKSAGLTPKAEANRRTLIRRLSFDLTGLPPTPEEVDLFLNDAAPNAYDTLVDRLLASPQYGVRWARWWLDVARFGESNGFEYDEFRPNAWRYRDWVATSLNRDLPYDEFVRLQIAGDILKPNDPTAIEATGFLVAGAYDTVGQKQLSVAMRAVVRGDELEDYIGTVGQTFLGLTVNCARCHDHKFDPIRQVEYYQIASALGGVRPGDRDLSDLDPNLLLLNQQIVSLRAKVEGIEAPARTQIIASRKQAPELPPVPSAAWDFDRGLDDRMGELKLVLEPGATLTTEGLHFDGVTGYAHTPMLPNELKARTIEAWVKLDSLDQRGGGVLSIQTGQGASFDAIVFGEQKPGRWLAGSNGFVRTRSLEGLIETEANARPIHVAISYSDDGAIHMYREGQPYGKPYKSLGLMTYPAGKTELLFGMRHGPVGGNRMLAGTLLRARLYNRALDPSEVAASAGTISDYVAPTTIAAALTGEAKTEHHRLMSEIRGIQARIQAETRKAYAVTPGDGGITHVELRGDPQQPGQVVAAGGVASLIGVDANFTLDPSASEGERRKRLAQWITHRNNPLFARVVVNRLWQAHFGTGLVETPSDLGFNAGKPSHPELLDWLASELVDQGWSLKAIHKQIVTSAAYRQSSESQPAGLERDAGNRLLWRKSPTRLEAEMVRDAMLHTSGKLDLTLGGASFRDLEATKAIGTPAMLYTKLDASSPGLNRRTLYRAASRGGRNSFLDAFDCPDPSTTAPRRAVTTTPLQALAMMNNPLVLYLSDALSTRLATEAGPDPDQQVNLAYHLAFGREPTADERVSASAVIKTFGAAPLARALFNSNEFLYVD